MDISILYAGKNTPHAGWTAIDELAELLAVYYDAEVLSPRPIAPGLKARLLNSRKQSYAPLPSRGGDVLIVVARNPGDLGLVESIPQWRKRFSRVYGIITDSYYQAGYPRATGGYDAITVTAAEDVSSTQERFAVPVHQLYQGADCLRWAPRQQLSREIDIIAFGRTPASYHKVLVEKCHHPESPWLYLHSPIGHLSGSQVHAERSMLFKLLQRTRISLAFHMYVEPEGNRPRSMMVTSRWLESLLAGCLVAGKRPVSQMASEMLFWPGATYELSDNAEAAAVELTDLLRHNDSLTEQRISNIRHMLLNHDWRLRIKQFAHTVGLPLPELLVEDISRLQEMANSLS